MRPSQIPNRRSLAALLILFSVSPCVAADLEKELSIRPDRSLHTQILQSNPAFYNVLGNRGIGFRVSGDYDRAIADLDAAIRINPDIAGLYLERGLAYDAKGEHQLATTAFPMRPLSGSPIWCRRISAGRWPIKPSVNVILPPSMIDSAMRLDRILVAALYMQRGDQ